uniref:Uncharacterized protein n=1 Tax=Oryzias melastigma TaxID=30732 RepID=A0A3B3CHQ5_ORYME
MKTLRVSFWCFKDECWQSYPPFRVGVSPKSVHNPTDMSSELRTVTTAASARPHLDLTMSIFPKIIDLIRKCDCLLETSLNYILCVLQKGIERS